MKEFIEKLIDRLEKEIPLYTGKIKRIINELSDEYKSNLSGNLTGWIPCSERLPEGNERVIACFAHGTVTELSFYDGLFHGIYDYNTNVIIAWQPLPEPYKQEQQKEIPTNYYEERFNRVV